MCWGGGVVLGERLVFGEMKTNKGSGRCSTGVWRITKGKGHDFVEMGRGLSLLLLLV